MFTLEVAELMLVAQYYGALKYAAETTQKIVELTPRHRPRKVFLMPLGGGSFQNPWETWTTGDIFVRPGEAPRCYKLVYKHII